VMPPLWRSSARRHQTSRALALPSSSAHPHDPTKGKP
jgi:hypothetical protein